MGLRSTTQRQPRRVAIGAHEHPRSRRLTSFAGLSLRMGIMRDDQPAWGPHETAMLQSMKLMGGTRYPAQS